MISKDVGATIDQTYQSLKTRFQNEHILWFNLTLNKQIKTNEVGGEQQCFLNFYKCIIVQLYTVVNIFLMCMEIPPKIQIIS